MEDNIQEENIQNETSPDGQHPVDSHKYDDLVSYEGVSIDRGEKRVLNDVTFTLQSGQFCYLVGRVGSGKSSLMKSMYSEVGITSGEKAFVMGHDLLNIKKKEIPYLRRKIGIVFQDFQLLQDRSVHGNLEFVLKATGWKHKPEIEQRIEEVLNAVKMSNKSYKMPHELSGGEQQRIVIARALLNKPDLIIADEPTGNLDPQTGYHIVTLLHDLVGDGRSVLMATHNLQLVDDFPGRVLRVEQKRLIEV